MKVEGNKLRPRVALPNASLRLPSDMTFDDLAGLDAGSATSYSSPAIPSVFDLNTSTSSSTTNMGTVSPQDLYLRDPFNAASAPNSTALTNLTSPSIYNESPQFDSFETSPNFGGPTDLDAATDWFPLFPQDPVSAQASASVPASQATHAESLIDQSPDQLSDDFDGLPSSPVPSARRKSGNSPPTGRHSSVSGVNPRRRDKPLPPIIVDDPSDVIAMKRARNTLAARKSRQRKAERFEELESEIAKLKAERDHWKDVALGNTKLGGS